MKSISKFIGVIILALGYSWGLSAQSPAYQQAMTERVAVLDTASLVTIKAMIPTFDRFAAVEGIDWLAPYYSAYCRAVLAIANKETADALSQEAETYLKQAETLQGDVSEIACLRAFLAMARLQVEPQTRWQNEGEVSMRQIALSQRANPQNPRIYYLLGESTAHTPKAFGGGADKALPLIERSLSLYREEKPATAYHPRWGRVQAERLHAQLAK